MDASLLLERQGWQKGTGLGFSGRGISKPLLVSQKQNSLGLGATTKATQWDQWWSKAFDSSLNSLQVDSDKSKIHETKKSEESEESAKEAGAQATGKRGLYAGFIKGPGLDGTTTGKLKGLKVQEIDCESSKENKSTKKTPDQLSGPHVKRKRKKSKKQSLADEGGRVKQYVVATSRPHSLKEERTRKRSKR